MTRDSTERENRGGREAGGRECGGREAGRRESRGRDAEGDPTGTSRRALLGATAAVATTGALGSLGTAKRRDGLANRDGRTNQQDGGVDDGTQAKRAFRFGGREQGWYGRAPQVVAGVANPTLRLEPGAVYEVTWENLDGEPHNFAFRDADGNFLPVILPEGASVEATPIANATAGNATENATTENAPTTTIAEETTTGTVAGTTEPGATRLPENGIERTQIIRQQGDDQTFYFVAVPQIAEYLCVIHPERMDGEVVVGENAAQTMQTTGAGEKTTTESE